MEDSETKPIELLDNVVNKSKKERLQTVRKQNSCPQKGQAPEWIIYLWYKKENTSLENINIREVQSQTIWTLIEIWNCSEKGAEQNINGRKMSLESEKRMLNY